MTRRRRWLVAVLATVVVAAVAWIVWPSRDQPYLDLVASLRAAGEPVDYDGLVGAPDRDAEAAGAELIAAKAWLHEPENVPYERWDEVVGSWNSKCEGDWPETTTPEQWAELAKFLREIEPYRARVAAAAAKPRLQEPRTPRDDYGLPDSRFIPSVQEAYRVLSAAAVGSPDEASRVEAMALLVRIGTRVEEPFLIHQAVASVTVSLATREIRRALEKGTMDPVAARAPLDPLLRERWIERVPPTIRGERVHMIRWYPGLVGGSFPFKRPSLAERLVETFRTTFKLRTPAPSAWPTFSATPEEIVAECDGCTAALRVPLGPYAEYRAAVVRALRAPGAPTAISVERSYGSFIGTLCRVDAQQGLARIALAAAEHRATHGEFPASLDELKPMFPDGVPLDPFTDAPFVYAKTATGVRIASAGRLAGESSLDDATLRERCLVWELKR